MKLSKWYFDCVSPEGTAFIGYAASLSLMGLRFSWSASRLWSEKEDLRQGFSRHHINREGKNLTLSLPRQDTAGTWGTGAEHPPLHLAQGDGISVTWQVLRPRSEAKLRVGARTITGQGYVERLDMELRKPVLPFTELHWGRFFPDDADGYCIWIAWRGAAENNWIIAGPEAGKAGASPLLYQSGEAGICDIRENGLSYPGASLSFEPVRKLTGNLIASHLPGWMCRCFGGSLVQGMEHKYLSRARWTEENNPGREGWALHEVVAWPGGDDRISPLVSQVA